MKSAFTKLFAILFCMSMMILSGNAQTSFSGTVFYHDDPDFPLGNVLVSIMDTKGNTVSSMTTGPDGNYTFQNIPNGSYIMTKSTTSPSGGVTLYDATLVLMHVLLPNIYPFSPLQSLAADVDGNGKVTMADYSLILKNYLTYGESFSVGNWVFLDLPFTLNGLKDAPPTGGGSTTADVSGPWVPTTRSIEVPTLDENASLSINNGSSFEVKLSTGTDLQLNGAGIVLNYAGDLLTIEAATCKSDEYFVNITENQVRINWIKTDGNAIEFRANEPIVTLTCKAKDKFTEGMDTHFQLDAATCLVDNNNEVINSLKLSMPLLINQKAAISIFNYPNPFVGSTVISYGIPAEGNVRLEILAQTGQVLRVVNAGFQTAGNYTIDFQANDLKPGMYFYRLSVTGTSTFSQTKQMIISN